jgi:hypothetical protein
MGGGIINLKSNLKLNKMKKFMFSAVAMIAFVGTSMASTVEVEFSDKKETATVSVCGDIYHATYIAALQNGATNSQAGRVAWAAYSTCVNKTISPSLEP